MSMSRRFVLGSRFWVWMKFGNLYGSRTKNTGVLLPHHVPVAFLGVELHGEAADVALGVGGAALAGDGARTAASTSVFLPTLPRKRGLACTS